MPIFAFQRPVSGRVEIVYGISIGRSDKDRLGGRLAPSPLGGLHRFVLHRVIAFAAWETVFIRPAISDGYMNKISVRRRRRRSPLQSRRFPRIVVHFFAVPDAPEEINDERDLGETHDPGRP